MSVDSFAKINLCLKILGKNADGYHDLETIFQEIDLKDRLEFKPHASEIRLCVSGHAVPADDSNLIVRAARLLQATAKERRGCTILLHKAIPAGAGLGGGSSNAAATLAFLNRHWGLDLPAGTLAELALQLGADVPFFLHGGTQLAYGRGELLSPLPAPPPYTGVLIHPGVAVSTRWAFKAGNFRLTKSLKKRTFSNVQEILAKPEKWQACFVNDLESVVFRSYPFFADILENLRQNGAFYTRMSGSGSCLYGLYETEALARQAIKNMNPDCFWLFKPVFR